MHLGSLGFPKSLFRERQGDWSVLKWVAPAPAFKDAQSDGRRWSDALHLDSAQKGRSRAGADHLQVATRAVAEVMGNALFFVEAASCATD